jgi:hypothetical protein
MRQALSFAKKIRDADTGLRNHSMRLMQCIALFTFLLLTIVVAPGRAEQPAVTQPGKAAELERLRTQLAPYFHPPAEFAGDFGNFKSPLRFDDGRPVRTADEWRLRRSEILRTWNKLMGPWPPLVDKPTIEYLEKESHGKYTQQRIRVQVAPVRTSDDAYLLVPEGRGPFPAVIVVFYDGLSGLGGGRGAGKPYDFARQLVKRGFVALSFGSDPNTYYPDKKRAVAAPFLPRLYGGEPIQRVGDSAHG